MPNFIACYNKNLVNLDHISEIMPVETSESFHSPGTPKRFDIIAYYNYAAMESPSDQALVILLKNASQDAAKAYMDALTANLHPNAMDWDGMPTIKRGELVLPAMSATEQQQADQDAAAYQQMHEPLEDLEMD